ncbi:helix-turn-helix transcriptional regulator [Bdellovibrionota bacterium FG-1]
MAFESKPFFSFSNGESEKQLSPNWNELDDSAANAELQTNSREKRTNGLRVDDISAWIYTLSMNPVFRLRSQAGVTQQKLALMAGTSQPTIASYEAGRKSPTLETLERLAKSMGLEVTVSFVSPLTREDLRSLAYHQAVTTRLRREPEVVLAKARGNLETMSKMHPDVKKLFDQWEQWLDLPVEDLVNCCLDASLLARDMRQVTPFAGILSAGERLAILKKFRKEENR